MTNSQSTEFPLTSITLDLNLDLKGNCGVKMTVFQGLGLSTLIQFLTLCFAGGVFQVRKTTKTQDQNVNRKPPSWNGIACSEDGQRLVE